MKEFLRGPRVSKSIRILTIAAWCGLAAGILEGVVLLSLQESGLAAWQWIRDGVGPAILWISPAFYLLLFTAAGLVWTGAAVFFPRRDSSILAVGFFAWMGFYPLLAATGRLNDFACATLALGCAVQSARIFAKSPERSHQFLRRTLPPLVAFTMMLAGGVAAKDWLDARVFEPRHFAGLPDAEPKAPNVLLVVMDTARADHFSAYGYERPTSPNLERLAREGALFQNAYSTSSWTLPSHASFVTGLFSYEHGADLHPLGPEFVTLAEYLDTKGYATASFAANTIWCTRISGFAQGFVHHEDYFRNWPDRLSRTVYSQKAMEGVLELFGEHRDVTRQSAADINANLLAWVDSRSAENVQRPFFVFVNYFDAHEPVSPPAPYDSKFRGPAGAEVSFDYNSSPPGSVSNEQRRAVTDAYDGAIAYMDAQLGALWAELERRGLTENTLLIVTSDHGESLGEAGLYGHRSSLRREQIHVPLMIRLPGKVPAGIQPTQPVSLSRIPASIVDVTGMTSPFRALSLRAAFDSGQDALEVEQPVISELAGITDGGMPSFWPVSRGNLRSMVTQRWHLIERSDGAVELYDLAKDLKEERNIADSPEGQRVAASLGRTMANWFAAAEPAVRAEQLGVQTAWAYLPGGTSKRSSNPAALEKATSVAKATGSR